MGPLAGPAHSSAEPARAAAGAVHRPPHHSVAADSTRRKRNVVDLAFSSDDEPSDLHPSRHRLEKRRRGLSGDEAGPSGEAERGPRKIVLDSDGELEYDSPGPMNAARNDDGPRRSSGPRSRRNSLPPVAGPAREPSPPSIASACERALVDATNTIIGILPDAERATVRTLLQRQPAFTPTDIAAVLEQLFAMDGCYPKEPKEFQTAPSCERRETSPPSLEKGKGKGKAVAEDEAYRLMLQEEQDQEVRRIANQWLDTATRRARSNSYRDAALLQLYADFPRLRQCDIKLAFGEHTSLYAPTFIALESALKGRAPSRYIKLMGSARIDKGKGRDRSDEELEREKAWVKQHRSQYYAVQDRASRLEARLQAEIASGAYVECGCCFTEVALSQLVACAEGCSFCKDCARMNADSQIGMRKYILPCMSTSGCSATFVEHEYPLFLSRKSIAALHRIKQEKEVDEAALEGLEKCPFCPFAMIIENPQERLFTCHREDCRIVSCRECKRKDHLPATCAEASEAARLSRFHAVEEAMSAALIRRCPKPGCGEPYVKESGTCNKIACSSCKTLSCYICGKIIEGYQHFANAGSNLPYGITVEAGSTCALWDNTDQRNHRGKWPLCADIFSESARASPLPSALPCPNRQAPHPP